MAVPVILTGLLSSCEQKVSVESVVSADGAIDRTIILNDADSGKVRNNFFGIQEDGGWNTTIEKSDKPENDKVKETSGPKYTITFQRHFASADDANNAMDTGNDTLFRVHSEFRKTFRWFYTYIHYSDTYRQLNLFRQFPMENFFTKEDHDFIARMPAEGSSISKADSIYLELLTDKIGDYFARALYEEHFALLLDVMRKENLEKRWSDSLLIKKGEMFSILSRKEGLDSSEDAFMVALLEDLKIGFPVDKISDAYRKEYLRLKPMINFMTEVGTEAKIHHRIAMPWDVVHTNADSVSGNSLHWQPMTIKFMLSDFTMSAESRSMNYWAMIVSILVILLTGAAFLRKRYTSKILSKGHVT